MEKLFRNYRLLNNLSIDVAMGAMVCAAFFARLLHVTVLPQGLAALGLTVWLIYTFDHLVDAKGISQQASTARHRFHQKHFISLAIFFVLVFGIDAFMALLIHKSLFYAGLLLAFFAALYVAFTNLLVYFKEMFAALIYTAGVLLPALALTENEISTAQALLIIQFAIIVFTNLVLFAFMSHHNDVKDTQRSIVTALGRPWVSILLMICFILFALIFFWLLFYKRINAELTMLLFMQAMLFGIFIFKKYFEKEERYRVGDLVFMFPILLFFF